MKIKDYKFNENDWAHFHDVSKIKMIHFESFLF